jgi:hypothetical protein|tara:strand:+ start:2642 stop:3385 length:744 start_codon:yes stop_codon:yes gene_type:complete
MAQSSSPASYLSSPPSSSSGGGGMAFDWATFGGFGLGAIGNIVGASMQARAQKRAARMQANAANLNSLSSLYGQQMAMRQNQMDRDAALYASSQNIKAAQDARADNYRYGMNANLMKTQSDINSGLIAGGMGMMNMLAGKNMDALNRVIDRGLEMRRADQAFTLGRLEDRDRFDLAKQAAVFRANFTNPMETVEQGRRERKRIAIALSPESRELRKKEREGRIKEAIAIKRGLMDKMFGNYSPGFYG